MKKRSQGKARRVERRNVQVAALAQDDSIYQLYSRFGTTDQRSAKEVLKQTMLLLLWFALLTTFFYTQNALLRSPISHAHKVSAPVTASVQAIPSMTRM